MANIAKKKPQKDVKVKRDIERERILHISGQIMERNLQAYKELSTR